MPTTSEAEHWLARLFHDEHCADCGGDAEHHDALEDVPMAGTFFARCRFPRTKHGKRHPKIVAARWKEDTAAIAAVSDALQIYEDNAREANEQLERVRTVIRDERVDDLAVSSKVRDRLAQFTGWGREVLRG